MLGRHIITAVALLNCWLPGPIITMAAPNRNYYYSKLFIEFSYIRHSKLKIC